MAQNFHSEVKLVGVNTHLKLTPGAKLQLDNTNAVHLVADGNEMKLVGEDGFSFNDGSVDLLTISNTSGYATFSGTVDATTFKIDGDQGTDGQVLTSTGSGVAWEDGGGTVDGSGVAERVAIWSDADTLSYDDDLKWDGEKLIIESGNSSSSSKTLSITHTRNNSDVSTNAVFIDANFSGTDNTTTDRTNSGLYIDLDSSADGDAADEVRSYGVRVDARMTGFNDQLYGVYAWAESNNVTEKTGNIIGVYGIGVHDSSSTNGGVSNLYGVRGVAAIQDHGDVDNAYGVQGYIEIADNRHANVDIVKAVEGQIQIDEATALTYGEMHAFSAIIDNNEGSVPTFSNQYLFKGDYQGTKKTGAYGIYVEGDRHYLSNKLGIGVTEPSEALDVSGNAKISGDVTINGGDITIAKQNDAPTMTLLHDGTNPSTNDLLFKMQFQSDFDGSHQNWGKIELDTNASAVRTNMDFYVKSTSGNEELGLRIEGGTSTPKTFVYGDLSIPVAKSLYFGGGNHTYIREDIDDRLRFFVGGAEFMRFTEDTSDTINFYKNVDIYTGAGSAEFNIGRNNQERLQIYQDDLNTTLTADNDSDSNSAHNFILNRTFEGSGPNNFKIQKGGTSELTIDKDGDATFANHVTVNERIQVGTKTSGDSSIISQAGGIQLRIGSNDLVHSPYIRLQGNDGTSSIYGDIKLDVTNQKLVFNDPGTSSGNIGANPMTLDNGGNLEVGGDVSATSISVNPNYPDSNEYLLIHKRQNKDGGIVLRSKPTGGSSQNDWQILNHSTTGDLRFYAYGLAGFALTLDREDGNATFAGGVTIDDDAIIYGNLTLAKSVGDTELLIEADTDNNNENDNPRLHLRQDGGAISAYFGLNGDNNNTFTGALANSAHIRADNAIQFANGGNTDLAMTIDTSQRVGIGLNNPSYLLHVNGEAFATEYNLPSGGMLDWANGDARIVEGVGSNYSLSFQTYDGSAVSEAMKLYGDNTALHTNQVKIATSRTDGILLHIHNQSNGDHAKIKFSDQTDGTQHGFLDYRHTNTHSEGGGASFHFTSTEADTPVVFGDSSVKSRLVVYGQNSTDEVDYGFGGDNHTGMYSPSNDSVGLVSGGSRKLLVDSGGVTINNGHLFIPQFIYHDGDTNTRFEFQSDQIYLRTGGNDKIQITNNVINMYTPVVGRNIGFNNDDQVMFAITEQDTTESLRAKIGKYSTSITRVDDATAPADGCFEFANEYENITVDRFFKVDDDTEYTFEVWVKFVSGTDTDQRLYAGASFYDSSKTYLGNSQRYWGQSAAQIDADTRSDGNWYHFSGTLGPTRGTSTGNIPNSAEWMKLILLLNYSNNANTVRYCGLKFYKSGGKQNRMFTSIYRKSIGSQAASGGDWNGQTVMDTSGNLYTPEKLVHYNDTDTYIRFSTNEHSFYAGGTERMAITGDVHIQGTTDLNINGSSRRINFTAGTGTVRTTTTNNLIFQTNSSTVLELKSNGISEFSGDVLPNQSNNRLLGNSTYKWADVWSYEYYTHANNDRVKYATWDSTTYGMGMLNGVSYGHIGGTGSGSDYVISFQMSDSTERGWWWCDTGHSNSQGAMSLTTLGELTVADSISIGEGESVTSPGTAAGSYNLYVAGGAKITGSTEIDGNITLGGQALTISQYIYHLGDSNSYLGWSANDDFRIQVGGVQLLRYDEGISGTDFAKFMADEFRMYANGDFHADGDVVAYSTTVSSDKRLKKNIKPINNALEIVDKLQGVHFNWKEDDKKSIGYIAQDVEKILPEMVSKKTHFDKGEFKTVNYAAMVSVMGEAIKELKEEVEQLKKQINGGS